MTAEIAILNSGAVALAADSAVTINTPSGQKIYNTVNKLFTLSKYQPVGIMVFDSASLFGVPWEVIIKEYRHQLGKRFFPALEDYVDDLLRWIEDNSKLFPTATREEYVRHLVREALGWICAAVNQEVAERLENPDDGLTEEAIGQIVKQKIAETAASVADLEAEGNRIDPEMLRAALQGPEGLVATTTPDVFGALPVDADDLATLESVAEALIMNLFPFGGPSSGIVVAGYGEDDFFPALRGVEIHGVSQFGARCVLGASERIIHGSHASIVPLAQREMVDMFISGIDPRLLDAVHGFIDQFTQQFPSNLAHELVTEPDDNLLQSLGEFGGTVAAQFKEALDQLTRNQFVGPIVDAVSVLPKDELAEMAESLVNLTSFKRRMSMGEIESVGGAIDVAVISKGDGFIWIKRKHYFRPELNQQFLANYLNDHRRGDDD